MKLILRNRFPSYNEHERVSRGSKYAGAEEKKTYTEGVVWDCVNQKLHAILRPVHMTFTWYRKNEKSDPDNIAFAKKYILDGLVKAGILEDDGWGYVKSFKDYFKKGKEDKVIVEIT